MEPIAAYVSIGDSMSIDLYPYLDASARAPAAPRSIGAASLLFANNSDLWPEFEGKDLKTAHPGIEFVNLAEDGATTFNFLEGGYLSMLSKYRDVPIIVTVTLGGNDLLTIINREPYSETSFRAETANLAMRYRYVMELLTSSLTRSICLMTSIYDPTDGAGLLPGFPDFKDKLKWLHRINRFIRAYAIRNNHLYADVYGHFKGHGLTANADRRWYWAPNPIEPSARGASEIRRLWLNALAEDGLAQGAEHLAGVRAGETS